MRKYFENITMIPCKFTIAGGRLCTVRTLEFVNEGRSFGTWNDCTCEILLAKRMKIDGDIYDISSEDRVRTFWHECGHIFKFFYGVSEEDECFANMFSMFIYEILNTAEYET